MNYEDLHHTINCKGSHITVNPLRCMLKNEHSFSIQRGWQGSNQTEKESENLDYIE